MSGVTIETFGSTAAALYSGNYYLNDLSTGTGPTLKYAGAAVISANYSTWSVIGAEKVAGGGYDVVWKNAANAHYSVWSTDSNGNFLGTLGSGPEMLGNDAALKALEPTLRQDLNGDGAVGAAPWAGDNFVFDSFQGPSEVPDPMPGWVGVQATSSSAFADASASQDVAGQISPIDILHALQDQGFLLG
nr:hypothetical protein [Bradyrhizobium sp. CCGE-LA001]